MKRMLIIVLLLLCPAATASADWMLTFADGTRTVWETCYAKGAQYCTRKEFGEFCVSKADVRSRQEVPAGTEGSETYGVSALGNPDIQRQNAKTLDAVEQQQNERLSRESWERRKKREVPAGDDYADE